MPRDRHVSPSGAHNDTSPSIRYWRGLSFWRDIQRSDRDSWSPTLATKRNRKDGARNLCGTLGAGADGSGGLGLLAARFLDHLVALCAELQERLSFHVETRQVPIHDRLPDHAERGFGAEIVLVVEAVHHLHDIVRRQTRILDVRHLMSAIVTHGLLVDDEAVGFCILIELGARIGV